MNNIRAQHYGVNVEIIPKLVAASNTPVALASIVSPSQKYMVMDSGQYLMETPGQAIESTNQFYLPGMGNGGGTCGSSAPAECNTGRHFEGVSVNFADGHAKWLKSSVMVEQAKRYEDDKTNAWSRTQEAS